MDLIESLNDLKENLDTLDSYWDSDKVGNREFYCGLIKRGLCFVVYSRGTETRFAPSRFIGYKNNNMKAHFVNDEKDGRETNTVIDKFLGGKSEQNKAFEIKYQKFCNERGIVPWNRKKKFWVNKIISI